MAIVIIIILGLILDQATKFLALKNLGLNESVPVIRDIFHFTLVFNQGAAFGIFKNYTYIFIAGSALTILFIIIHLKKQTSRSITDLSDISLALILSGAMGNLADRIRFGFVVDFLDFRVWPVFNLADTMITTGTILLAYSIIRKTKKCTR